MVSEEMLQIMDERGTVLRPDLVPALSDVEWLGLYKAMVRARAADDRLQEAQREGRLLIYPPNTGQEAAQVGPAAAMGERDWLVPSFRELGAYLYRGVDLATIFLYWAGFDLGSRFPERVLPITVPIGTQMPHAVGIAMASSIKGEDTVTVAYIGDGGTSTGDFSEALNFAGVFNAPVVFIVQNNQYSISVPRLKQTRAETLAQKAVAAGIPGMQVDGNDLFAMYAAAQQAIARARSGGGPTLIEACTYRLSPHITVDKHTRYRRESEVAEWRPREPLRRMKAYLMGRGLWSEEQDAALYADYSAAALEAFRKAEAEGELKPEDLVKHTYKEIPAHLREQYEEYVRFLEGEVE